MRIFFFKLKKIEDKINKYIVMKLKKKKTWDEFCRLEEF